MLTSGLSILLAGLVGKEAAAIIAIVFRGISAARTAVKAIRAGEQVAGSIKGGNYAPPLTEADLEEFRRWKVEQTVRPG